MERNEADIRRALEALAAALPITIAPRELWIIGGAALVLPHGTRDATALVEVMAERNGAEAPSWTRAGLAAPERVSLVRAAESLPRQRRLCEEEGPEPLRRRGLRAPPDFLTVAQREMRLPAQAPAPLRDDRRHGAENAPAAVQRLLTRLHAPVSPDEQPSLVYLNRLSSGSHRAMGQAPRPTAASTRGVRWTA